MNKTLQNPDGLTPEPEWRCPHWCSGHDEDEIGSAAEDRQITHVTTLGGDTLDELRNALTGRLHRGDKGSYEVYVSKLENASRTYNEPEFIHLEVGMWTGEDARTQVELRLMPGEARSMAAVLIAAADALEIFPPRTDLHRFGRDRG